MLAPIFDVAFDTRSEIAGDEGGALLFGLTATAAEKWAANGVRAMWFVRDSGAPSGDVVEFSSSVYLEECFRQRKLRQKPFAEVASLPQRPDDEVIASFGETPFWLLRKNHSTALDLVAIEPSELGADDYLYSHLNEDNWARLLPLMHFLREVSGWQAPPIRACFMFDDPNLHWPSYGYLRYRDILDHAREHNYHVALATIPLDCWFVHSAAAKLFRLNSARLSLLFHGNNHTYYELAQAETTAAREALVAQAIRRVERFERRSGIKVARAMAAPHGACSVAMGEVLLRGGFEVACISRSSLMNRNPEVSWPKSVGMMPAEFFGGGLPVVPRFNIRWDTSYALFAAFLGQPIILVGHHDDLVDGLELLERWAAFINQFGSVRWCDVEAMSRSNYCLRRDGQTLEVQMFSREIELDVPEDCNGIRLYRPWLANGGTEPVTILRNSANESFALNGDGSILVYPGERIKVRSRFPDMLDISRVATSYPSAWAVTRRQLCEVRDRLRPVLKEFTRSSSSPANNPFREIV